MDTIYKEINCNDLDENDEVFQQAAKILKMGGLVSFPTETVYGLGANALDEVAVKGIYDAKGRPSDNPLIVHICEMDELFKIAKDIPDLALKLAKKYWPGPLTLVLNKQDVIPKRTSGGLNTVAVRMPSNSIARKLIKTAGFPIAAPSSNISGRPSPTTAQHVLEDLNGRIDMIIDGGKCEFGLESTIVDFSEEVPMLLRPGSITLKMIENVVGEIRMDKSVNNNHMIDFVTKAPGMKYKHYSPKADVTIVLGKGEEVAKKIIQLAKECEGVKIGILGTFENSIYYNKEKFVFLSLGKSEDSKNIGSNLFSHLRKFDELGVEVVYSEGFLEEDGFLAIMNRLKKAAGFNIIEI